MEKENKNKIYIKNFDKKKEYLDKMKSENKNKYKLDRKNIIMIIVFVLLIIFGIFTYYIIKKKNYRDNLRKLNYSEEKVQEHIKKVDELKYLNEDKRARKYLNYFIKNIKEKKYDEEYAKMYSEYKNIFFPTLNDFDIYIKNNFPKDPVVKINNFENIGGLFILFVDILDKDDASNSLKNMKFIYKEEDLNKYVFSFSVKNKKEKVKEDEDYELPPNMIDFTENPKEENSTGDAFDLIDQMKKNEENNKENNQEENK